jgi:DNA-binding CsgD family transcriptional regulator
LKAQTSTGSQLLERDAELAELRSAIQQATAGGGRAILIEGPAGAGKSALLSAAVAARDVGRLLRASGSELERDFAFGGVRQLFEPLLGAAGAAGRRRLLRGSAAPARWLFGARGDAGDGRAAAGFAVFNAVYWLAVNLAADEPLVLAVDDLHWVDESSLRAFEFLTLRIAELPIALVATLRPSEPDAPAEVIDAIRAVPGATRVAPAPLTAEAVAELVRRRFPDADDDLCGAFHESSAGNPLYLRELLLSMAASGLPVDGHAAEAVRRATVPTLGERLARRIDRVAPQAGELTTAMAVLGDGVSLHLAGALAGVGRDTAARIARRLTEIEVLRSDDPFAFAHPVLRRSLYDRLAASDRARLHSDAARVLREAGAPPEKVAAHLSALPPAGSDSVVATLLESARVAVSRAAPGAAIPLLRRALEENASQADRPTLLYELGRAEMTVRDPSALTDLQQAFDDAGDARLRALVAVDLTELLAASGRWEESLTTLARARSELRDSEPELAVELEALRALTTAFDPRGVDDFNRNRRHYGRLATGDSWAAHALASLLATAACSRCEGRARTTEYLDRALSGGRLVRERGGAGWAAPQLLLSLVSNAEYDRAVEVSDEIGAVGRSTGSMLGTLCGLVGRNMVYSRTGDLVAAEPIFRTVFDVMGESGMTLWLTSLFQFMIDTLLERPQLADAVAFADAIELDPIFAATGGGAQLLEARGRLALARNERERGLADLRACAATYEKIQVGPTWTPWRSELALAIRGDDPEHADRLVADELELARASGVPEVEGRTLRAAGILARGERGVELLRESASLLEPTRARLEHARSLVELGAALRHRRRQTDARAHLENGMDLAYRCGAERLVARADAELRAAGARPRRIALSGVDALTASELRVARLAAEGMSNSDIAQDLYVTTKTVETHLSRAYSKLGLAGRGARRRLPTALASSRAGD